MKQYHDPDLKYILAGILSGLSAFFIGIWPMAFVLIIMLLLYGAWKKFELMLFPLAFFVVIDFGMKSIAGFMSGWWDELLLVVLFVFLLLHKHIRKEMVFRVTSIFYPVLLFAFIGLCSILNSTHVSLSQGIEGIRSSLQAFLFFLLLINAPISKKTVRAMILMILLAGVLTAVYGIYQYLTGVPNPPHWLDKDTEVGLSRAFSFLGSPNAFAAYGVLLIPVALGFLFRKSYRWHHQLIFGVVFLLLSAGVFSSLTRAAWVALLPALALFGILIKKTRWMLSLMVVLVVLASLSSPVRTRFTNLFSEQYQQKSELGGRNYRWNLAWSIFEESPLLGRGPGSYGGAVAYRAQAFQGLYVDNYYLQILSNYGILGFLAFLWILLEILRQLLLSARFALDKDKPIVFGIFCGVTAFLVHNFTENLIEVIPLAVIFWILSALACRLSFHEEVA